MLQTYKKFYDSTHGYIQITQLAGLFIDKPEFQRLRYLKQLGVCSYVFPNATHTRFEHSIGTYYLTGHLLKNIKRKNPNIKLDSIPELADYFKRSSTNFQLDDYVCELVKIAGLCHDIGHGPFSHVFDKLVSTDKSNPNRHHETRSCLIVEHIIKNDPILKGLIHESEIKFIQNLIIPSTDPTNHFIYQIVANNLNHIDVDKFDYLTRDTRVLHLQFGIDPHRFIENMTVIDNQFYYSERVAYDIVSLFQTRYRLHKQVYHHKTTIAIEYMFKDMYELLDPVLSMSESINTMSEFIKLTDHYFISMITFLYDHTKLFDEKHHSRIRLAYELWKRLVHRKLYKCVRTIILPRPNNKIKTIDPFIKNSNVIIHVSQIGWVGENQSNPLDHILWNRSESKSNSKSDTESSLNQTISFLLPPNYYEYVYMFFVKDPNDTELIKQIKSINFPNVDQF